VRQQLETYADKFEQLQTSIQKCNDLFTIYRRDMETVREQPLHAHAYTRTHIEMHIHIAHMHRNTRTHTNVHGPLCMHDRVCVSACTCFALVHSPCPHARSACR
jgi:hypothetical protein